MAEQKLQKLNYLHIVCDFVLCCLVVGIIGITFWGVSAITPRTSVQIASHSPAVLGAKDSASNKLTFFSLMNSQALPFVQSSSLSGNTHMQENVTATIEFAPLDTITYDMNVVSIKNPTPITKTVTVDPAFSIQGSYATISIVYEGVPIEVVSRTGVVTPVSLTVSPNTSEPVFVRVVPSVALQTPSTLTLGFTEKQ